MLVVFSFCVVSGHAIGLRETVEQLSKIRDVNIWLDRRVDPDLPVPVRLQLNSREPMRTILQPLAESLNLGYCEVGNIIYIGPEETAALLPLLFALRKEQMDKLPDSERRNLTRVIRLESEYLDTPAEVVRKIMQPIKGDFTAFDQLPHDLWPELRFSKVTPAELLTVLLAGFDMTFVVSKDGKKLAPVKIPHELVVSREYPVAETESKSWKSMVPNVEITYAGSRATVRGTLDDLAMIENLYQEKKTGNQPVKMPQTTQRRSAKQDESVLAQKRFTGTIENKPVRLILESYAHNMGIKLVIDEESFRRKGESLETPVSFELKNATAEEAFRKCLAPIHGMFKITTDQVHVYAKPD